MRSATPVSPTKFFTLTFVLSWLIWIPLAMSHFGVGPFHVAEETSNVVRLLGVLMPAVSALILTRLTGGRDAMRNLCARLFLWRVDGKWWLAAVAGQPALLVLAAVAGMSALCRRVGLFAGRTAQTTRRI